MTSDRPYPGQGPGPDGNPQANPNDQVNTGPARGQAQSGPDNSGSQFAAYSEPTTYGEVPATPYGSAQPYAPAQASAPPASAPPSGQAARAAVRMPPGLVASAPPPEPSSPPPTRGAVYGRAASIETPPGPAYGADRGGVYGSAAAPSAEPGVYGSPAAASTPYDDPPGPRVYGQPYGAAAEAGGAGPQLAPPRPVVPQQRTPAVYGQRSDIDEPQATGQRPGRQTASWQEQLQPDSGQMPPMRATPPPSTATPADVAVVPVGPGPKKLRILGYVSLAVLVVSLGVLALYYTSRTSPPKVGSCVQESGDKPLLVSCSTPGAFKVGSSVTDRTQCPDYLNQPTLKYGDGAKTTWLCLQPAH